MSGSLDDVINIINEMTDTHLTVNADTRLTDIKIDMSKFKDCCDTYLNQDFESLKSSIRPTGSQHSDYQYLVAFFIDRAQLNGNALQGISDVRGLAKTLDEQ